jgi:thiol-disulfide isomerase/thioredoxin
MQKNKNILLVIGVIVAIVIGYYEYHKYHSAPNLELDNIPLTDLQGRDVKLSDFKGKTVFLNFWGTWCGPCVREMPTIDKSAIFLKDKNIVFLTISDEKMETITNYKTETGFNMTFLKLKTGINEVGIFSIPTTYIISPSGAILFKENGSRDWNSLYRFKRKCTV